MNLPDYTLNEDFLDLVFGHMFGKRGTYGSVKTIQNELESNKKSKFLYNDVLMALDQLATDDYLILEPDKWDDSPVYRLTYKGYLEYKSSKSKRPYSDRIKLINNKNIKNISTKIAIIINAIAIIAITGWSVYIDQKDSISKKRLFDIENRISDIEKTLNTTKNDTILID